MECGVDELQSEGSPTRNVIKKFFLVERGMRAHGSVAADVHEMVIVSEEVGFAGTWRVIPATRGVTRARRLDCWN